MPGPAYIVIDTETTGISAAVDRVIEIAAVRVVDGRVVDRFSTLVDPGVPIPPRITRLTGISTRDLAGAPQPGEVWPRFLEFAGDGVRVAHNAAFDRSFVASELARLDLAPETVPYLCTVRLSRRLLPGLPSKGLDSVARFFGIPVGVRHRALADAEITAEVLLRLAERAGRQGHTTPSALLALQQSRYASTRAESAHVEQIRRFVLPTLPEGPGVYRFHDVRRRLLYVGKAVSLVRRVSSYFSGVEAKPGRIRDLVTRTRHVEVEETGSEVEALLLEARLIRELQPPYNRALRQAARSAWLRFEGDAVSVRTTAAPDDGAAWYGPMDSPGEAQALSDLLGAALGLRAERRRVRTPYEKERAARVERAAAAVAAVPDPNPAAFLEGDTIAVEAALAAAMAQAAAGYRFEEAAVLRDWIETLQRLTAEPGPVAPRLRGTLSAHVLVGDDGLLAVLSRPAGGPVVLRARDLPALGAALEHGLTAPGIDLPDAARIVGQWAYRNREAVRYIEQGDSERPDTFVLRVVAAVAGP